MSDTSVHPLEQFWLVDYTNQQLAAYRGRGFHAIPTAAVKALVDRQSIPIPAIAASLDIEPWQAAVLYLERREYAVKHPNGGDVLKQLQDYPC